MFNEDYFQTMASFKPGARFKQIRSYGSHTGYDLTSCLNKHQDIYNMFDGRIVSFGNGRDSGNYITVVSNPVFIGGINTGIYVTYKHLSNIEGKIKDKDKYGNGFISSGTILGKMGNTGYCKTKNPITRKWRLLTEKERNNPDCKKGVHIHWEISEPCEKGVETELLKELCDKAIIINHRDDYILWQWGRLYYKPSSIINYFKMLQGWKK